MKKISFVLLLAFLGIKVVKAEEGMLIPTVITAFESDMQAMGMRLSAQDIYNVNGSSLKDAIIHFGGGCTAELVSSKGLLLTNHHCGYSQIQSHSSLENDYLKYGFWAKTLAEELPNKGLTAARMVRIVDVTKDIMAGVNTNASNEEQAKIVSANAKKLIEEAKRGTHYEAEIKPFNYGNDFYMIVKEVFKDVRLVGTPPNLIGKFGGDTDNWVWPRHTGDFSVFRIYVGSDNKPADYSASNVPYSPLHFLKIAFNDRKEGDFTMVYGFPGTTEQHMSSEYIRFIVEKERTARIKMRDLSLNAINNGMNLSDEIRIQYASKQARIANAWKKWIGQIDGLRQLNAVEVKQQREQDYEAKAQTRPEWKKKYGQVISDLNQLVISGKEHEFDYAMGEEYFFANNDLFQVARRAIAFVKEINTPGVNVEQVKEKAREWASDFYKNYNAEVDRKVFVSTTEEYNRQVGAPSTTVINLASNQYNSEAIYTKSILTSEERFLKFVNDFKVQASDKKKDKQLQKINKDAGLAHYNLVVTPFFDKTLPKYRDYKGKMDALLKLYVAGLKEMNPEGKLWADANSTLRITYGKLEGSQPHDGMKYLAHTTLKGMVDKFYSGNPDFELNDRVLELYKSKEYGKYAQDGELWVCFTGSNHTTGGNSGSPVLDANGNLMGLNFDRTWESTMSDYMFDASRCRNITVDIRYVMWVMDIYAGARHLVEEMEMAK